MDYTVVNNLEKPVIPYLFKSEGSVLPDSAVMCPSTAAGCCLMTADSCTSYCSATWSPPPPPQLEEATGAPTRLALHSILLGEGGMRFYNTEQVEKIVINGT